MYFFNFILLTQTLEIITQNETSQLHVEMQNLSWVSRDSCWIVIEKKIIMTNVRDLLFVFERLCVKKSVLAVSRCEHIHFYLTECVVPDRSSHVHWQCVLNTCFIDPYFNFWKCFKIQLDLFNPQIDNAAFLSSVVEQIFQRENCYGFFNKHN